MKTKFFFRGGIMIFVLTVILLVITAFFIAEHTNTNHFSQSESQTRQKIYVCSMHPEVIRENPGDCPICGMSLIEKPVQSSPQKVKIFVCSMHPEVIRDKQGDCPICGMLLIEKPVQKSRQTMKIFVCSMHPEVIRDKQGDCPICGMSLIEKIEQDENSVDMKLCDVVLPVNEQVLASVQTVSPVSEELPILVEASGIVNYDSRKIRTVSAHFRGLIEKSYIKYQFQPIRKGQKIYDIYCPEIYLTHMNYVNLIKKFPDKPDLIHDARNWLVNIGLSDEQIESLINDEKINFHLSVFSDADGFVVNKDFNPEADFALENNGNGNDGLAFGVNPGIGLSEGVIVEAGTPLFKVVNLNSIRADLKIKTEDAGLLKVGQNVILSDAVSPDRKLNAKISLIEPLNGGLFQVARIYISDQQKRLYPGMKIQALIEAGKHNSFWVSKMAVAQLGQHQVVFVRQDSAFVAKAIKTGLRSGDKIEICSEIDQNSVIAANASLLTDSDGFIKTNSK